MEGHTSLGSLTLVVAIAFFIPIILHKLRLKTFPVVVAEILAGLLIGKSGLNLIADDPWLELLSMFGLIYLMFLSGLEIDFSQLGRNKKTKGGPRPLAASLIVFCGIMAVSYGLGFGLMSIGFVSEPYLMMIIIATISLGVVVPVLKEQKLIDAPFGQTLLLVTVIADFVTMIMLAVYISMLSESVGRMALLLVFFALVVIVYFLLRRFMKGKLADALLRGTSQLGTRGVFALILIFVVLSENMGVENILGAFLAGVVISLLLPDKSFVHQLESFGYGFLIPIFFVMVGVKLDLWELLQNWKILLFIPVLLIAIYLSKIVPALVLRYWFSWKESLASGILLSSTLSLVIAAATVALEIGIIDDSIHGALILVAILTCFISPILFNRLVPKREKSKPKISIIGANHVTLPVSQDLMNEGYTVELFSAHPSGLESKEEQYSRFPLTEVQMLDVASLDRKGAFAADIIVCGSMDEVLNMLFARHARKLGVGRIIVRMEDPETMEQAQEEGFTVFSTLYSTRLLLKGLIDSPSAVRLITQHDDSIQEAVVQNPAYHNTLLRDMPFLGNTLVLRIYRGQSFIIPHGSTEIHVGDRLLVSGASEHITEMKRELE
ncbi:monovalent cation:proton antiporter family protein [Paenibacillus oceani]|uniref:Monovalent cation:proton antiporter family protein n=1 Tax=Paenibacillus oceani TaxID=2772510 RepID=A0A927C4I8_9BACL|nr:cation:proton antiporter [Paenibacillus oceani]MBD2861150.1 monovalent cation:proton antiporter family protein [Paenibacillus oceani]